MEINQCWYLYTFPISWSEIKTSQGYSPQIFQTFYFKLLPNLCWIIQYFINGLCYRTKKNEKWILAGMASQTVQSVHCGNKCLEQRECQLLNVMSSSWRIRGPGSIRYDRSKWSPGSHLTMGKMPMASAGVSEMLSSVQSLSHVWIFVTPWTAARQASLSITNSQSLLKLMSTELVMPSNHLILCRPLLLLPSIFPSTGVFSNESALRSRWPKYWSFSFNISPSNEHSGLISFRMDWLDLLAV